MKASVLDISWLPAREEWDFRAVTVAECPIACHWEYARQISQNLVPHSSGLAKASPRSYVPTIYRQVAKELFPQAWGALTAEQRAKILSSFYAIPSVRVRKLGDFLKRMQGASLEIQRAYAESSYVVQPNFSVHGVEAVIKEFEVWARKEAKQHRQSPRAKAAEPPFNALKWLAVLRVEAVRCQAGINFERAQEALINYRLQHPRLDASGVFPIYASHGAWSKARTDAQRLLTKVLTDSSDLLAGHS